MGALITFAVAVGFCALVVLLGPGIAERASGLLGGEGQASHAALETVAALIIFGALLAFALGGAGIAKLNPLRLGRNPLRMILIGTALGLGGLGTAAGSAWVAGALESGPPALTGPGLIIGATALILFMAAVEEVYFRGWLQPVIAARFGTAVAVLLSALAFAALHLMGGARSPVAVVNLFLGGLLFGLLAARGGGLAGSIAAHFAWNWSEQILLGVDPNPGVGSFGAIFNYELAGSSLWGGSDEGLNASLAMTLALVAMLALLLILARARSGAERRTQGRRPGLIGPAFPRLQSSWWRRQAVLSCIGKTGCGLMPRICMSVAAGAPGRTRGGEMVTSLRVESGAKSHEGRVRERNEDSFVARERNGLWAVADGMGGAANGDWASAKLIEALEEVGFPLEFDAACEAIAHAIHKANGEIYERSVKRGRQMGSTIVALYVEQQRFVVFWVGDSRAYLLRDGALHRVSKDHSQVQEMIDRGLISARDAEGHPMGHVLARAVGVGEDLDLDAVQGEIQPGDVFLLCSDGLHGYVPEADIARLLGRGTPEESAEQLVALTLERGAPDNVTVIAIGFSEPTLLSLPETVTA